MLILNSGGTFNKRYNKLNGLLEVPYDNQAVETILHSINGGVSVAGVVYKDSLEMDMNDRKMIANIIMESDDDTFIIIHGTDTMKQTAEFLDEVFNDKKIVLTGAMKPFEIDSVEASLNIGMAMGYLNAGCDDGVYVCMSGFVESWNNLEKNRAIGKFEIVG